MPERERRGLEHDLYGGVREETYKPFSVALEAFLVENLDSDRKRFEANPDVLINVAFINSSKTALSENVIGAETLGDRLQLV